MHSFFSKKAVELEVLLCEYKARINPKCAQKEEDHIKELRESGEMIGNSIFAHVSSNDSNSYDFIASEEERLQALHHA